MELKCASVDALHTGQAASTTASGEECLQQPMHSG
jgi:hypothetical protein